MLFAPFIAEEAPTALVVHPFWVLVSIVNFLILLYRAPPIHVGPDRGDARQPRGEDP